MSNTATSPHALVVGASGGIGLSITTGLLRSGFRVSATFRSGQKTIEQIDSSSDLELHELDVKDPANCASVVASAESAFGPVSGLVYAAGITRDRPVSLMTDEQWNEVLTVNLSGVFYLTREVVKSMMLEKRGSLVYIGSVSGQLGNAGQVNYSASKAGLIGMAKTLAVELGPYGIRCNVVAPGPIETPMTQAVSFTKVEALRRKILLRRFGSPLDVSAMVCYLLSESGCYISGQVITIDGGLLAS